MTTIASDTGRRILVTLNTAGTSRPAIDIASHLAGSLNLLLEGVFIEDEGLLDLSELPFLREISPTTFLEQAVDPQRMRQSLAAQARQLEDIVQRQAAQTGVQCLFRTWRGHATLQSLSSEFDAHIISVSGVQAYRQTVIKKNKNPIANLYLILDEHAGTEKLVTAVHGLTGRLPFTVSVLFGTVAGKDHAARVEEVHQLTARLQPRTCEDIQGLTGLASVLSDADSPMLFIEAVNPLLLDPAFEHLIKSLAATVFIVR